jgi:hypothetical protein
VRTPNRYILRDDIRDRARAVLDLAGGGPMTFHTSDIRSGHEVLGLASGCRLQEGR